MSHARAVRQAVRRACLLITTLLVTSSATSYGNHETHIASEDISNITYIPPHNENLPSIFSPRMDFEQWKPLTGRGDPLQNDPTYDYEPPKLDRVRYWIDSSPSKHEEKVKSEVLVLGVSSKKPSVVQPNVKRDDIGIHKFVTSPKIPNFTHYFSRPNMPPRHRPTSNVVFPPPVSNKIKYEDYSYKITDNNPIPMTILVPPPPPPPGQIHNNYYEIVEEQHQHKTQSSSESSIIVTTPPTFPTTTELTPPSTSSSLFVQESNLIYQSSTVHNNWDYNNVSTEFVEPTVSSDYAGWGPTKLPELEESYNYTQNLINSDNFETIQHPYLFYRPMFVETPPPSPPNPLPTSTRKPYISSTPEPVKITNLPFTENISSSTPSSTSFSQNYVTIPPITLVTELQTTTTESTQISEETSEKKPFVTTTIPTIQESFGDSFFDMLGPMFGMPMANGPERPEDKLYSHSTENMKIFKQTTTPKEAWEIELETMQTMQPPPITVTTERMPVHFQHNLPTRPPTPLVLDDLYKETPLQLPSNTKKYPIFKPISQNFQTSSTTEDPILGKIKTSAEIKVPSTYLIIQGHSKVKTYGSKPKSTLDINDAIDNEIPQSKELQVKHLHPLRGNETFYVKEEKPIINKVDRSKNRRSLRNLVSDGVGKIEIQEANLGIQYDVSDGTGVPIETYRKGFVDDEEVNYSKSRKNKTSIRRKRQIDLEDILPIDEDDMEEYIFDYLKRKSAEKSVTGLIASAVTSDAAEAVDELEDDDSEDSEERR